MITHNKYTEILKLAESLPTNFNTSISFGDANKLWNNAVYYNKLQNSYLKENEPNENVHVLNVFDEDKNNVVQKGIKASNNYTRLQWLKILLADSFYLTYQQMKEFI